MFPRAEWSLYLRQCLPLTPLPMVNLQRCSCVLQRVPGIGQMSGASVNIVSLTHVLDQTPVMEDDVSYALKAVSAVVPKED